MVLAIQFAVGICCFVVGLSMLFHRADWLTWFDDLRQKGKPKALVMGIVGLGISSLIFGFHQVWSGIPLIVTLIGVIGIIEGIVYLLFPAFFAKVIACFITHTRLFAVWAILATLLGAVILCDWWSSQQSIQAQAVFSGGV